MHLAIADHYMALSRWTIGSALVINGFGIAFATQQTLSDDGNSGAVAVFVVGIAIALMSSFSALHEAAQRGDRLQKMLDRALDGEDVEDPILPPSLGSLSSRLLGISHGMALTGLILLEVDVPGFVDRLTSG